MSNLQLTWSEPELLANEVVAEPLVAGGVRCHGGFAGDGAYVSPRTKNRVPATKAWQQSHREQFGTEILDAPIELWPEVFPNVAQTKFLLREGVPGPTISALTRIGTVEGFGSMIRAVSVENMQSHFAESIDGTAIAHLQRGLFEAHARDEAGWEEEAGHKQMWFAARDIAFENPVTEDMTQTMLVRMGIVPADGKPPTPEEIRRNAEAMRRFPDLDLSLEMMVRRMVGLLFIEVSAFHTFAWAEEVLADTDLVAGDGARRRSRRVRPRRRDAARRLPAHRAHRDARPHVRRRVRRDGARHRSDRHAVGHRARTVARREPRRRSCARRWARSSTRSRANPRRDDILEEFLSLGPEAAAGHVQ